MRETLTQVHSFAGSLKQARQQLSLTQTEMADLLGVEQTTVSRWERGAEPTLGSVAAIADVLEERNIPFPYLEEVLLRHVRRSVGQVRTMVPYRGEVHDAGKVHLQKPSPEDAWEGPPGATSTTRCLILKTHELQPILCRNSMIYFEELKEGDFAKVGDWAIAEGPEGALLGMVLESKVSGCWTIVAASGPYVDVPITASSKIIAARMR